MKHNGKSGSALKMADAIEEAHEEDGRLTQAEVEKLTDETAGQLLALGGGEAQDGIDRGRIIDGYVEKLQPNGKFTRPNPFDLLTEREDIPWRASQLRTYRNAYLLWRQMGGVDGAPKVDVTTIGLVLPLDFEEARKVLNHAAKDKLTTRQVAAMVKKIKGTGTEKAERVTGNWKALDKAAERLESELGLMRDNPAPMADFDVVDRLEAVVKSIQALIESIGPEGGTR